MIEVCIIIVIAVGGWGMAEYMHYKTGNGKRFEQVHRMLDTNE